MSNKFVNFYKYPKPFSQSNIILSESEEKELVLTSKNFVNSIFKRFDDFELGNNINYQIKKQNLEGSSSQKNFNFHKTFTANKSENQMLNKRNKSTEYENHLYKTQRKNYSKPISSNKIKTNKNKYTSTEINNSNKKDLNNTIKKNTNTNIENLKKTFKESKESEKEKKIYENKIQILKNRLNAMMKN